MKLNHIISTAIFGMVTAGAAAQMPERTDSLMLEADPWLHIYYNSSSQFDQYEMSKILELRFDANNSNMLINHDGKGEVPLSMKNIKNWAIGPNTPRIDIYTENWVSEITSKTEYLRGEMNFYGRGIFDDVHVESMRIRGRGNSTWNMPKKPYRLKFDEKTKFGKVKNAKNLVLLANYMDKSLMRNFVAMKFARMIGADFPNHVMPCDVYLNGLYKGNYMLTEKVGINNGSIDIPKEQEVESVLFELDTNSPDADEVQFTSSTCKIPVNFKDPDAPVDADEAAAWHKEWQADFNAMEAAAASGSDKAWDYIDLDAFVRYVMVFNFCTNQELKHPKSVYVWKTRGDKYRFGPVWDFDWAYGFDATSNAVNYEVALFTADAQRQAQFSSSTNRGISFFLPLVKNAKFLARYAEIWNEFYSNEETVKEFFDSFDAYADILQPSAANDATILQANTYYHSYLPTPESLRSWLVGHMRWINEKDNNYGLWEENNSSWGGGGW
ncbi:MAG: CotH kinase family protein [Muribaculaceae bacterium]|nr:CotH kinase family protein [Muribaculaceae bacterium]